MDYPLLLSDDYHRQLLSCVLVTITHPSGKPIPFNLDEAAVFDFSPTPLEGIPTVNIHHSDPSNYTTGLSSALTRYLTLERSLPANELAELQTVFFEHSINAFKYGNRMVGISLLKGLEKPTTYTVTFRNDLPSGINGNEVVARLNNRWSELERMLSCNGSRGLNSGCCCVDDAFLTLMCGDGNNLYGASLGLMVALTSELVHSIKFQYLPENIVSVELGLAI